MKNNIQQTKPFGCNDASGSTFNELKDTSFRSQTEDGKGARDKTADSIQERFNKLKDKLYKANQIIPLEKEEVLERGKEMRILWIKFKDLQKEIENKTYGCGESWIEDKEWKVCTPSLTEDQIDKCRNKEFLCVVSKKLCPTCKVEKEADEKILKQIKEMLK